MSAPETWSAVELVAAWDRGDSLWTVEMGGLGPGYEQAIQVAMIEIVRDNIDKPLPVPEDADSWGDDTLRKHSSALGGLSGAQAGAARSLAYRILKNGYGPTLDSMRQHDKERLTQVSSNRWPHAAVSS